MTTCPDIPLAEVGILAIAIEIRPVPLSGSREISAYLAGRDARIANWGRSSYPQWLRADLADEWMRGWDIVDYQLNHPEDAR